MALTDEIERERVKLEEMNRKKEELERKVAEGESARQELKGTAGGGSIFGF